jgi:hypothetical protein
MTIDYFGAGVLYATPTNDANGNAIAVPSPVQFGIVQNVTIDDSAEVKELYGANQYPVDIGRGKAKIQIKVKQALFNAELFNTIYYGQTLAAGYDAIFSDTVGQTVPTGAGGTAIHITPTSPFGGTSVFVADLGVASGDGVPYTRVASGPTAGQYSLAGSTYTFSNADAGTSFVFINYQYSNSTNPSTATVLTVNNIPMGNVPVFSCQFFNKRRTHTIWRKFPQCVATKLTMDFKNDDFVIPDLEISAFADSNNVVQYYSMTE